jgi:hypothetical protein
VDIFLGFAPYVAFFVVLRMGTVEAAMWAAFAVAALVALYGRWRGRSAKILEIGGVALFGLLALFTAVSHWDTPSPGPVRRSLAAGVCFDSPLEGAGAGAGPALTG